MNVKFISIILAFFISVPAATAGEIGTVSLLEKTRENVIKQYINDLQSADAEHISELFVAKGTVVSTSRGAVDARDFFHSFLPEIESASTELHGLFINTNSASSYTARFHFIFNLKDGEQGEGEYIDEFIFATNSSKLLAVYMFENLKFETK